MSAFEKTVESAGGKKIPELDGVRGLAVLLVVLYHLKLPGFSWGFVGVDIFFILSGFLICRMVMGDLSANCFSFRDFYFRRARRILPSLLLVCTVTGVVGFFLLPAQDFLISAVSVSTTAVLVSNFFYWLQASDYWSQIGLSAQPLLHTWSISVEEQFYLVFPYFLVLVSGKGAAFSPKEALKRAGFMLAIVVAFSLGLQVLLWSRNPSAAFYLMPCRLWELALGAWLYVVGALAGEGAFGIPNAFVGGARFVLRLSPLRNLGHISYAVYLWHWPVFVFSRSPILYYWLGGEPPIGYQLAVVSLLSVLSWYLVEKPMRAVRLDGSGQRSALVIYGCVSALVFSLGLGLREMAASGFPFAQPVPSSLKQLMSTEGEQVFRRWQMSNDVETILREGGKKLGVPAAPEEFIVAGDSFAGMWGPGLDEYGQKKGRAGLLMGFESCPVLDGLKGRDSQCEAATEARLRYIEKSPIRTVALANKWMTVAPLEEVLSRTLNRLKRAGKNVFIVMQTPGSDVSAYAAAIDSARGGLHPVYRSTRAEYFRGPGIIFFSEVLARLAKSYSFGVLRPTDVLCVPERCLVATDGLPVYEDGQHLNRFGSVFAARVFDPVFSH